MSASELFKKGDLQSAIATQLQEVKADPANEGKRLFLFELLAFAGDLDRAGRHLDALKTNETEHDLALLAYRQMLDSEQARRRLFSDGLAPRFLGEQPEHVRLRLDAVNRLREDHPAETAELLSRANAAAPPLQGHLNGRPFTLLRDCDDLFGTVLEVMRAGAYYWLPLEQAAAITLEPPRTPRDLLWAPAQLKLKDGQEGNVFLPALYPGSHVYANDPVKLGRVTDWKETPSGPVLGAGLRTYLVDEEAISLLEWRELTFAAEAP